ncbi:hypothetical protein EBS80_01400, partial [bacterium]|nr:hypothetical protein [bacterium]
MLIRPNLPRWVLSGGPKSGKSTIIAILRAEFGHVVHFLPEVCTLLHDHAGIIVPTPGTPSHHAYSRRITRMQIDLEDAADDQAHADGKLLVCCDRGIVDNIAYLEGGEEEFERVTGVSCTEARGRYAGAHVLELAPRHVFVDPTHGFNPSRREGYDEALALDGNTYGVWAPHPRCVRVTNERGWDGKIHRVMTDVRQMLHDLG